jgi:hypothetical protein
MIGILLVIKVPDTSYKRMMTSFLCPINGLFLSFEGSEHLIRVVFDYIILNGGPFRATLRTSFYINVSHGLSLGLISVANCN